jgi:hypothetical protein
MMRLLSALLSFMIAFFWLIASTAHARDGIDVQSENFRLIAEVPVDGRAILSDLEMFRSAVLEDLGVAGKPPAPLTLTLTDNLDLFDAVTPGGITAGIYLQSAASADIVIGYSSDPDHILNDALEPGWLRLVLRHEVVHHLVEAHYPRKLPIWFGEGLAEYYATFDTDPNGLAVFGRPLPEQDVLSELEGWLPMRTVIESMARYPEYNARTESELYDAQRLYYGQAAALAHFVVNQPEGLTRIHRFVDGLEAYGDSEDSFEAAFGLRYESLEARMRERVTRGEAPLRARQLSPRAAQTLTVSPLTERIRYTNQLRLLLSYARDAQTTSDLSAALRAKPQLDRLALEHAEALFAWRQKDWTMSDQWTARILARNPRDPRALKIRAKVAYGRVSENQTDDKLWAQAEAAALDALRAAPDDAQLHLFRVAVSLPDADGLPLAALASLDWLRDRDVRHRLPHEAMMMIPALIYEGRLDRADAVLDTAARWTTDSADRFVIDRLRANVANERARLTPESTMPAENAENVD